MPKDDVFSVLEGAHMTPRSEMAVEIARAARGAAVRAETYHLTKQQQENAVAGVAAGVARKFFKKEVYAEADAQAETSDDNGNTKIKADTKSRASTSRRSYARRNSITGKRRSAEKRASFEAASRRTSNSSSRSSTGASARGLASDDSGSEEEHSDPETTGRKMKAVGASQDRAASSTAVTPVHNSNKTFPSFLQSPGGTMHEVV